jgi:hypothetical protein
MALPSRAAPGQTLEGRFLLLETIGRGGMSTVFKARDLANGDRLVAVKVALPEYSSGVGHERAHGDDGSAHAPRTS